MTPAATDDSAARAPQNHIKPFVEGLVEHWDNAALGQAYRDAVPDYPQVPIISASDISPEEFYSVYVVCT